ncbi:MAG TPA: asparagine--tRNA ligase [Clostridiales bacterium]|nr:asparagine--tRNA ligase [Clostridiales bacterium]
MKTVTIKELYRNSEKYYSKDVQISGWIRTVRDSKTFGFLEINDGSFFKNVQIVFDNELSNFSEICKYTISSSVNIMGEMIKTENAKQPFEIKAKKIELIAESSQDYPLQKKRHTMEYLRTIAHLRPRTNTFNAVFRIRSVAAYAIHKFLQENNFVYVNTPIITGSDAEGAGEMFCVNTFDLQNVPKTEEGLIDYSKDFFGKPAHLTVSGQLNVETYAFAFRNVYTFGPTFRAENSNTIKHAAEFWMIEPEMCFADLNDAMDLEEEMLKFVIKYVLENCKEEMEFLNSFIDKTLLERLNNLVNSEFGRITYTDAIKELEKVNDKFEYKVEWGTDLQTEHERYLSEQIFKKPVFVTDYPAEIKAFYMKLNPDKKTVAAADLLAPGIGEIIGGSQREDSLELLQEKIKDLNMDEKDYWWYLDLRKYGSVPHSGFGIGFERLIMYITGVMNIRDVIPFPRTPRNCEF